MEQVLVRRGRAGLRAALPTLALGAFTLGCVVYHHHDHPDDRHPGVHHAPGHATGHGPPPHAPAHGYRRKHAVDHVDLAYDADVGVYVVLGREAVYWDGERYLRWADGHWQAAVRIEGVWVGIGSDGLPPPLVARHPGEGKGKYKKAKKRGHGYGVPARRAD